MDAHELSRQLQALAALDEPLRRRLYLHVAGHGGEVSRDEAARAAGVSRALAAFHLERLVDAGLLEATFRRVSGRSGPGAGRPSKLYRRSRTQLDVTLPERRYELAAQLLARVVADDPSGESLATLARRARERGRELARELPGAGGRATPIGRATRALARCGYEPRRTPAGDVVLCNCPFDSLAAGERDTVCGMNLALIEGLLSGLGLDAVRARLAPQPGHCCVVLDQRPARGAGGTGVPAGGS